MASMTETEKVAVDDKLPTGVTFSGATFKVPPTHDMVKTLFDPTVRKSYLEILIVTILLLNFLVFLIPQNSVRILVFIGLYVVWRLGYNFGIGYLLYQQSNNNRLVEWAHSLHLFDGNTVAARFAQAEVKRQRGSGYDPKSYPIEFNTWLLFRKVVDLILMSDFTAFMCVVMACAIDDSWQFMKNQPQWVVLVRIVVGVLFVLFNLWVKVNAHNTIKDYAWYWGDFFFRQINNEELIFDGVFEMVPHPMYSVGYIGYYGFALIAKSYTVLCVAIFGHFLQMIFLHYIENPHIDKIYGPSIDEINSARVQKLRDLRPFNNLKPMVGLANFSFFRASDVGNVMLSITYGLVLPCVLASVCSTPEAGAKGVRILFWLAVATKVLESVSIDVLLILQSSYKYLTKWYLSMDMPAEKSLNNWAMLYNSLINLTYTSLVGFNLLQYLTQPEATSQLLSNYFHLRIFLGVLLVFTQTWINKSIVESIGYFGWFYGDFFVPRSQRASHLTKAGVYRYLNNPEQIFGVCGVMGVFLIFPSIENFSLMMLWVVNNFIRFNFIEKAHMIKVYGEQEVSQDSGVTKTFKKHLIPEAISRRLSNDHEQRRRRDGSITETIDSIIRELRDTNQKVSNQKIKELSQSLEFENSEYSLKISNLTTPTNTSGNFMPKYTTVGTPITIEWASPQEHNPKNWVGLYRIIQTSYSRNKTLLSSHGRWTYCNEAKGMFTFSGEKLFWEEGMYEFRYHIGGKHEVAYISEPFEIKVPTVTVPESLNETENLATSLNELFFTNMFGPEFTIDDSIAEVAEHTPNMIEVYRRISYVLIRSTDIKVNLKAIINNSDNDFNLRKLAAKLIDIHGVLDELSYSQEKKHQ